ncbi:DUF2690 domain-containing protein [Streptomyces sp. NBC_01477]|uniref:DUF2690 domain-containing protein n=1 Tax=Streptomyces sp. NBC_01477 TaxID=2976015 RepID=UPI002E340320|nr:DUF2690 domain-containing protein [Streptomyces sp. NBC_01477]
MRRPARFVAACLVAAAVGVPLTTGTATAATGSQYDYTDPAATGCSGNAITYWSKNLLNPANGAVTGVVELRYSRTCQTNWVRVNNYVGGAVAEKIIVRPRTLLPQGGSLDYAQDVTDDALTGYSYGLQFYAPAGVCVEVGGVIRLNGVVVGNNGQTFDLVC